MVVVGADVHKRTHTFVAVDQAGRRLAEKTVTAVTAGHAEAVMWAREQFGTDVVWAIEDCRHLSARLERDLLAQGQKVVRVPPKLMAQTRASARTRGKSDPIDALAVARGFLREPDLPVASHDEVSRELKLLVDRREVLVAQRTATINRLLWRVHELDPERAPKPRSLDLAKHRQILGDWLEGQSGIVAELARDELAAPGDGAELRIRARHVVNAAGVWAGTLAPAVRLRPSRGSHLIVPAERLGRPTAAINVALEGSRSRFAFALPRPDGLVLIGITDVPVFGEIPDEPAVTPEEERGLLHTLSTALEHPLERADVVGRYAGLRPLLESQGDHTADLSRRHAVVEDPETRVVTVAGGKLTTYRAMAQDAVDAIARREGVQAGPCVTAQLPLVGAQPRDTVVPGLPRRLLHRYGAEAPIVAASGSLEPLADDVPTTGAELRFAVEHELALTPDDLLDRRTRIGLVPARRAEVVDAVRELIEERLPA